MYQHVYMYRVYIYTIYHFYHFLHIIVPLSRAHSICATPKEVREGLLFPRDGDRAGSQAECLRRQGLQTRNHAKTAALRGIC